MLKSLAAEYNVEIDKVGKGEWTKTLEFFDDATIYQSWSYGAVRWSQNNMSHLVLKRDSSVVALAQARIQRLPFIGAGIAYITWGPLWRIHRREHDLENLRQMIRALRDEYVVKRGLLLRIVPPDIDNATTTMSSLLASEGMRRHPGLPSYRTFLIDLSLSLEELRKGLAQKWRNCLNRAGRNNLTVIEGTSDELYDMFSVTYKEMHRRKRFAEFVDIKEFRAIQANLCEPIKMRIMVCHYDREPVSALICSAIGDRGIYILGATNNKGMKLQGSYLLQWRAIEWLKTHGCRWYDLGGIDPENNPGTYHFKAGLSGKSGRDVRHIGQFDMCQNYLSQLLVKTGEQLRMTSRKIKLGVHRYSNELIKR